MRKALSLIVLAFFVSLQSSAWETDLQLAADLADHFDLPMDLTLLWVVESEKPISIDSATGDSTGWIVLGFTGVLEPSGFTGFVEPSGFRALEPSGFSGVLEPSGFSGALESTGFSGVLEPSGFTGFVEPNGFTGVEPGGT